MGIFPDPFPVLRDLNRDAAYRTCRAEHFLKLDVRFESVFAGGAARGQHIHVVRFAREKSLLTNLTPGATL